MVPIWLLEEEYRVSRSERDRYVSSEELPNKVRRLLVVQYFESGCGNFWSQFHGDTGTQSRPARRGRDVAVSKFASSDYSEVYDIIRHLPGIKTSNKYCVHPNAGADTTRPMTDKILQGTECTNWVLASKILITQTVGLFLSQAIM